MCFRASRWSRFAEPVYSASTLLARRFCPIFCNRGLLPLERHPTDGLNLRNALAILATLWLLASFWVQFIPSADLWWLLATGRQEIDSASIPSSDPFSWSAPAAHWHNDQWLTAGIFYVLYAYGGLALLHGCKALLLTLTWALAVDAGVRRLPQGSPRLAATMLATALALSFSEARFFFDVRAYLFTYLGLMVLWRWILLDCLRPWKVCLLFLVWSNLHGGVSSGLLLLGLEALRRRRRREFLLLGLALVATLINPGGLNLLLHPLKLLGSYWGKHLNEWAPAWKQPGQFRWHLFHLILWMAIFLLQRGPRGHQWLLVALGLFSLTGWRHIPLFAWLSLPLWIELLAPRLPGWSRWPMAVGFLAAAGLRPTALFNPMQSLEGPMFPAAAVNFLAAQNYEPRLFHPYGFGGYLAWRLHPRYQVAIDGRAVQVYPWQTYREYLQAAYDRKKLIEYCQRHGVNTAILFAHPARVEANRKLLDGVEGWTEVYRDPLCSVYRRSIL